MLKCPGCGSYVQDHMTKCTLCGCSIPDFGGIPVSTQYSDGTASAASFSRSNGMNINDVLQRMIVTPTPLLFDSAKDSADSLRVIGLRAGAPAALTIPESHNGKPITEIAEGAFAGKDIVSVHIPASVTSIAAQAFEDCRSLSSVTGCQGLTIIGPRAFAGCIHLIDCEFPSNPLADITSFAGCFDGGMALEKNVVFKEED